MKVLVIGNDLMVQRLKTALSLGDIEVYCPAVDIPLAPDFIHSNQFDLVIIDNQLSNAEAICNYVYDLVVAPVLLMISERNVNWKTIINFKVDGFLTREASNTELLARVEAKLNKWLKIKA
jgi:DNA-binding response OmpR family regulator